MGNDIPFGGKIFLFGGDFRQTLPVLRHASNTAVVENCIASSFLRPQAKRFSFTRNMRANSDQEEFKSFLMQMGNGELPTKNTAPFADSVEIPSHYITTEDISKEIFPDNELANHSSDIIKRAILCPTNRDSIALNSGILDRLLGEKRVYSSVDSLVDIPADEEDLYPLEYLNSLTPSGMPTHNLFLKEGAIVMLLRNLNTKKGLSNGIRLIVRRLHNFFIDAEILTGSSQGKRVFIPKMTLIPSDVDLPFRLRRIQFPIRLAYAMTINKSQGQTFDKVGIYLTKPCFSHGQPYVAFSRARASQDIRVLIDETPDQGKDKGRYFTKNPVLRQLLIS